MRQAARQGTDCPHRRRRRPHAAELLKGLEHRRARGQLPTLEEGEYYWHQLEGLRGVPAMVSVLGRVNHLMETGANDVLVIKPCEGSIDRASDWFPGCPATGDQEAVISRRERIEVDWDPEF